MYQLENNEQLCQSGDLDLIVMDSLGLLCPDKNIHIGGSMSAIVDARTLDKDLSGFLRQIYISNGLSLDQDAQKFFKSRVRSFVYAHKRLEEESRIKYPINSAEFMRAFGIYEIFKSEECFVDPNPKPDRQKELMNLAINEVDSPGYLGGSVIRTVFGASSQTTLRGLSYFVPALELCTRLKEKGIEPPAIEFIAPYNFAANTNGNSPEQFRVISTNTELLMTCGELLASKCYEGLKDKVRFLVDNDASPGYQSDLGEAKDIQKMVQALPEEIRGLIDANVKRAEQHGDKRDKPYLYAAMHLLVHDLYNYRSYVDLLTRSDFTPSHSPNSIITIGCAKEEEFLRIRKALREEVGGYPAFQIQSLQERPPYYKNGGYEPTLIQIPELADEGQIIRTMQKFEQLQARVVIDKLGGFEQLKQFLKEAIKSHLEP